MKTKEQRKAVLLGMPYGTAAARLRKQILFHLVSEAARNICFRCNKIILTADDLSIEHKKSWQLSSDPVDAFFDQENIAFSHLSCNCSAILKTRRRHVSKEAAVAAHTAYTKAVYDPSLRHERYLRNGK